jgi:hypothetical protein
MSLKVIICQKVTYKFCDVYYFDAWEASETYLYIYSLATLIVFVGTSVATDRNENPVKI